MCTLFCFSSCFLRWKLHSRWKVCFWLLQSELHIALCTSAFIKFFSFSFCPFWEEREELARILVILDKFISLDESLLQVSLVILRWLLDSSTSWFFSNQTLDNTCILQAVCLIFKLWYVDLKVETLDEFLIGLRTFLLKCDRRCQTWDTWSLNCWTLQIVDIYVWP